jgi:seryl-tRNA synthetase
MHDIRFIRENSEAFDRGLTRRGLEPQAQRLISLDERRRAIIHMNESVQARRNALSKEIGHAKAKRDEETFQRLMAEVAELKASVTTADVEQKEIEKQLDRILTQIPNLPLDEVPDGKDESDNVEDHRFGEKRQFVILRNKGRITPTGRNLIVYEAKSRRTNSAAVARKYRISPATLRKWLQNSADDVQKPHFGSEDTFIPKQHFELGEALGQMDFEAAAKISGARFVVLKKGLARLERALGQFMLDVHTSEPHNYLEISPPLLVHNQSMFGTAQLPKFQDDQFSVQAGPAGVHFIESQKAGFPMGDVEALATPFWLIPTAEVPLTNLVRESIVEEAELPLRVTACTTCFRAEAGAAGKDTRGMIRQHQFTKVELVSITTPEQSKDEHERMLACAEEILRRLDLHYRVVTLCTGDMGFASQKTYDIEVWLPGQNMYREISSCSVCGEFQARRMNARYRTKEGRQVRHVHTLNGSGVAVGRALIAVMETYQQEDGSIAVPDALLSYMGGMKTIASRE